MSTLGTRLAEERKRLALSQSAFAESVGVSFSTQRRYEDGRSSPDASYLDAIERLGIDGQYVLTGFRAGDVDLHSIAVERVLFALSGQLGITRDQIDSTISKAFEIEKAQQNHSDGHSQAKQQIEQLVAQLLLRRLID